jgi:hypothetical protein
MTQNFSSVYSFRKTGSGQFLQPRQVNRSPGLAKIAPWWLARRDSFSAKAPGLMVGVTAPPTLTAYTREPLAAIIFVYNVTFNLHSSSRLPETVCGSTLTISLMFTRTSTL